MKHFYTNILCINFGNKNEIIPHLIGTFSIWKLIVCFAIWTATSPAVRCYQASEVSLTTPRRCIAIVDEPTDSTALKANEECLKRYETGKNICYDSYWVSGRCILKKDICLSDATSDSNRVQRTYSFIYHRHVVTIVTWTYVVFKSNA